MRLGVQGFEPDFLKSWVLRRFCGSLQGHPHGRRYDDFARSLGLDPDSLNLVSAAQARKLIELFASYLATLRQRRGLDPGRVLATSLADLHSSVKSGDSQEP